MSGHLTFNEYQKILIFEEVKKKLSAKQKSPLKDVSNDTQGVLHELLTGYHLRGGRHMIKHNNEANETPKQAHDRLKSTVSSEAYREIHKRAKSAAEDIKKQLGKKRVKTVHWTSKPGDIHKSTGIHATQKEDASDIIIHHGGRKHTGVSLKVSNTNSKVPLSNPGLEHSTYGAKVHLDDHQERLKRKFKPLRNMTSPKERKEWHKNVATPEEKEHIKKENDKVLKKMADHLHSKLNSMSHEGVKDHVRKHVLKAFSTPMEKAGKGEHIRHSTHGIGEYKHSTVRPSKDYEHILSDPKNIKVKVDKAGNGVAFSHKGKVFARHRLKFNSQSDPLSGVKGSGGET